MDKKYLKRVGMICVSALTCVCLLIYFGFHLYRELTTEVELENASAVTVTLTESAVGYVMKNEVLLSGNSGGQYAPAVSDGTKVGVGDAVAALYTNYDASVVAKISELDSRIELLENTYSVGSDQLKNTGVIDSDIFASLIKLKTSVASGQYDVAASQEDTLIPLLMKRNIITGAVSLDDALSELRSTRASLVATLGECKETVYTGASGYYYSVPDGYEAAFSANDIMNLTYSELCAVLNTADREDLPSNCCGKLVTDYKWYVAAVTTRAVASEYEVGAKVGVIFEYNGDERLDMTLERVLTAAGKDDAIMILSSGYIRQGFDFTRAQPIKLVTEEIEGFRIPISAVRVQDGCSGVFILDIYVVRFREIDIIRQEADHYIVQLAPKETSQYGWLERNDKMIVSGKGLYDGRVLN